MRAFVVTPPEPVVSWEEASDHLKLDGDLDQQAYVMSLVAVAQARIDGPGGDLGRAIGRQLIEVRFDNWDCGSLRLPFPPVSSVESVHYIDGAGVVQTVAPSAYELLGASLAPVWGGSWPNARWQREAVRVRYWAGYGSGAGEEPLPASIRGAILLMLDDLFRNRGTVAIGETAARVPMSVTVENLLERLKIYT